MISVDTNVVVRLLTGDDQKQFKKARSLFERENIMISTSVVLECEWVLRYAYEFKSPEIIKAFRQLFGLKNVRLQDQIAAHNALTWHRQGLDFADAIHLAESQDSESFVTFDKKLIGAAARISDFSVKEP